MGASVEELLFRCVGGDEIVAQARMIELVDLHDRHRRWHRGEHQRTCNDFAGTPYAERNVCAVIIILEELIGAG